MENLPQVKVDVNPFTTSMRITALRGIKGFVSVSNEQGINTVGFKSEMKIEWEKDAHINLYKSPQIINLHKLLTPLGGKLFLYVSLHLPKNSELITFDYSKALEFLGIKSVNTLYKAIQELVEYGIINKKKTTTFWINPNVIFNGNRLDYFKKNYESLIDYIDVSEIKESRSIKKKKDLIAHFGCNNYYQLKQKLGDSQIEDILSGNLALENVKLLR